MGSNIVIKENLTLTNEKIKSMCLPITKEEKEKMIKSILQLLKNG